MFDRKNARLDTWDYTSSGWYYVTIVTQGRIHRFGHVGEDPCVLPVNTPVMQLLHAGHMIDAWWKKIPERFPHVTMDEYIIMPNHVHGVLHMRDVDHVRGAGRTHGSAPTSLSDIVQWFKTMTTNEYIRGVRDGLYEPFDKRIWQRSYYDHIIRDEDDLNRIRQYIRENPAKWDEDEYR